MLDGVYCAGQLPLLLKEHVDVPGVEQAEGVKGGAELQAAGKPAPKLIIQLKRGGGQ